MKFGLTFFPTDDSMRPDAFARAAEARGFESIWFAEHSHIPVSPATPGPPAPGKPGLPREYYAVADPFVSLAMAAAATERIRLATGICLVPQRDVFQTAKQVATLDRFSGGRFLFGIGGGWNRPEIADHGTDPDQRFVVMRERIEAMKRLWTQEQAEYHGRHVDFGPCYAWPKPVQKPHPPIHVGGAGRRAIRRAVRYGDGWIPLASSGPDDPVSLLPELRKALEEVVARCREAGIERVLFPVPSADAAAVEKLLDGWAASFL